MAYPFDVDCAEIDRQHVKRGSGAALHHRRHPPGKESAPCVCIVSIIMARVPAAERFHNAVAGVDETLVNPLNPSKPITSVNNAKAPLARNTPKATSIATK